MSSIPEIISLRRDDLVVSFVETSTVNDDRDASDRVVSIDSIFLGMRIRYCMHDACCYGEIAKCVLKTRTNYLIIYAHAVIHTKKISI